MKGFDTQRQWNLAVPDRDHCDKKITGKVRSPFSCKDATRSLLPRRGRPFPDFCKSIYHRCNLAESLAGNFADTKPLSFTPGNWEGRIL
ncbi:hypothetical protein NIES37_32650 [Tolypothrix tenuis PCC 7101]|uniref:Uncharacterized protein n=1 Tax=Tolypothrix tenuis PCC 7101 TaxID=231146 RepID=A0A1Z4N0M4_9CYAN|nr:hypothetical protein NIES37_32650 [Tolypothrix tenuis PCC 7101]BAZ76791.1 hypothetical protein NIES50_53930 [Aulosira laxa NIES-50]